MAHYLDSPVRFICIHCRKAEIDAERHKTHRICEVCYEKISEEEDQKHEEFKANRKRNCET